MGDKIQDAKDKFEAIRAKNATHIPGSDMRKAESLSDSPDLQEQADNLKTMLDMLKDTFVGKFSISTETIVAASAAILYLVWVLDAIPDFLPIVGFLDDLAVIAMGVKYCAKDMTKYEKWRTSDGGRRKHWFSKR